MAQIKRHAAAKWQGSGKDGAGTLTTQSATLRDTPYGFNSRFGDGKGVSDRGIHNAHPIAPGKTASFTVKFPSAGTYRFYCAIKGHAAKGMQMNVKVT